MKLIWIVAFALVSCLAGGAETTRERIIEEELGGADAVRGISEARAVQMWRLVENQISVAPDGLSEKRISEQTEDEKARDNAVWARAGYHPLGDGVKLDEAQANALKKLLTSAASYTGPRYSPEGKRILSKKSCGFSPIMRALFSKDNTEIEVWVCFRCSDLFLMDKSKVRGGGEFKPIQRELLALVQSVFKDDPVIMKIGAR
jgi:hypothetical protein